MEPLYKISVDDQDITNKLRTSEKNLLETLSVSDRIGEVSDSCDFTITYDGSFKIPPTNGRVEISIGYNLVIPRNDQIEYGLWKVGTYVVESINFQSSKSGGKTLQVSATSMPQSPNSTLKSLQNSHTRYWQKHELKGTTFEDVVNEVCTEAGLKSKVHSQLKGIKMPFTAQINQTDAEFLTQISSIRDAKVKYYDDQVIVTLKDKSLLPEITIDGAMHDIMSYSLSKSARNLIKRVDATYRDSDNKIVTLSEGEGEPLYIVKNPQPDEETARNVAKTLLAHAQRGQTAVTLSIATQPNLRAESPITLINFDEDELNGTYICEEVRHNVNKTTGLSSMVTAKQRAGDTEKVGVVTVGEIIAFPRLDPIVVVGERT